MSSADATADGAVPAAPSRKVTARTYVTWSARTDDRVVGGHLETGADHGRLRTGVRVPLRASRDHLPDPHCAGVGGARLRVVWGRLPLGHRGHVAQHGFRRGLAPVRDDDLLLPHPVRFAGRRETEVASDLARLLRQFGHSQVDFTVVGSGPNGANPHQEIGERVIQDGDMVVLDFGGLKYGYGSDTTRTVHVGEPTDEEREVHDIVRRAQQAGFEAVQPGIQCQDVDRAVRAVIREAGDGSTSSTAPATASG